MEVNIEEKVIGALRNHSKIEKIDLNMYLDEIGIDPQTYVETCMDLEEELGIRSNLDVLEYNNIQRYFGLACPSPKVSDVIKTVKEAYEKSQKEHSH